VHQVNAVVSLIVVSVLKPFPRTRGFDNGHNTSELAIQFPKLSLYKHAFPPYTRPTFRFTAYEANTSRVKTSIPTQNTIQ
jgi:hypothetical protein